MAEYIDKQELIADLKKIRYFGKHNEVELLPDEVEAICDYIAEVHEAADVVEVVLCGDCKNGLEWAAPDGCVSCDIFDSGPTLMGVDDYCSNGERREGGDT